MYQNPERLGREQTKETTEGGKVNYPIFNQRIAEKENFVTSEVNESQPRIVKSSFRAANF